jgi:hypothetical protein
MSPSPSPEAGARPREHLPAWMIERLAFEPEAAPPGSAGHLEGCARCRTAADRLRAERGAFLDARPTAPFVAGVVLRAEREDGAARARRWSPRRWFLATGILAAASAATLLIGVRRGSRDEVRFKGEAGATFVVFVGRGGRAARPLDPAESLRPGDVLRFGVVSPRSAHAFVASIDEGARFSRYYPGGDRSAPLDGREYLQILPGSVVLDDTVGREWIVLVVSAKPIEARRIEDVLRRAYRERSGGELGRVDLDAEVVAVTVTKVRP